MRETHVYPHPDGGWVYQVWINGTIRVVGFSSTLARAEYEAATA